MFDGHLKGKKHINNQKKLEEQQQNGNSVNGENGKSSTENGNDNGAIKEDKKKATAWHEVLISKYAEALSNIREETKANVERKQALTDKERTVSNLAYSKCYLRAAWRLIIDYSWSKIKMK